MGETRATSIPAWQSGRLLGTGLSVLKLLKIAVKLNTGCVQNVVTTWRGGLGRPRLGTYAEDFFPGTGDTYPHLDEIHY